MIRQFINSIISLVFPSLCLSCDQALYKYEPYMCTRCWALLPEIADDLPMLEGIEEKFWGRAPIQSAKALYYFNHGTAIQTLLHKIKYNNRPQAAYHLGKYYGQKLMRSAQLPECEAILPIPLHPIRMVERGFNQSEAFAEGIATVSQKPIDTNTLIRRIPTTTQTNKTRQERFHNVEDAFSITSQEAIQGKKIILVDDLITTGATIIGASKPLLSAGVASINVITIAVAF